MIQDEKLFWRKFYPGKKNWNEKGDFWLTCTKNYRNKDESSMGMKQLFNL
jgi:hypothetical protein